MAKQLERRSFHADWQVRDNGDGTVGVRGYAAVFDSPAHGEVIKRTAFNRTLQQKDNVRLLRDHNPSLCFASTRAGTMTLEVDDRGLIFDAPSLDMDSPDVRSFVSAINRGDVYQCSFAGYWRDAPKVAGQTEVREVELVDVSGVTFPWYDDTEVGLTGDRSIDRELVTRSAPDVDISEQQRAQALRNLRAAPPGKTSFGDEMNDLWDAIEDKVRNDTGSADVYVYLVDWGTDWAVYRIYNWDTYEYGPHMQCAWSKNTDGTYNLGEPFEVERITEYRPLTTEDRTGADLDLEDRSDETRPAPMSVEAARALLGR
jgi:HK97 family phage prohead protease